MRRDVWFGNVDDAKRLRSLPRNTKREARDEISEGVDLYHDQSVVVCPPTLRSIVA